MDAPRESMGRPKASKSRKSSGSSGQNHQTEATHTSPSLSPKGFTSFPDLISEPESPKQIRSPLDPKKDSLGPRARHSLSTSYAETSRPKGHYEAQSTSSALNRTLRGAANLRKVIMASLITSQPEEQPAAKSVFDGTEEDSDPLLDATDEQIQRIIDANGGAIASIRQFSADLAESNRRVTQERTNKLVLLEETRQLREENEQLKSSIIDYERRYDSAMQMLKHSVEHSRTHSITRPDIKVVDSPGGPYLLDSMSGQVVSDLRSDAASEDIPLERVSSSPGWGNQHLHPLQPTSRPASIQSLPIKPKPTSSALALLAGNKQPRRQRGGSRGGSRSEAMEMKDPIDVDDLPPALQENGKNRRVGEIDRLGFLFTTHREQRHQEALRFQGAEESESSSMDSFPLSDDDIGITVKGLKTPDDFDYQVLSLSAGDSNGELLCYAPVGPAVRLVSFGAEGKQKFIDVAKPSQSAEGLIAIQQSSIGVAPTSVTGTLISTDLGSEGTRALNSLLTKLNETYDAQQKRLEAKWTVFNEQVRATLRKTRTDDFTDYNMASIARLCSPGTAPAEVIEKFNTMIVWGIPVSLRQEIWTEKSGANALRSPGVYQSLLSRGTVDEATMTDISADVERTLANNVFFRDGVGRKKLRDVLIAYSHHNPEIGYSQGLNIIAANLLLLVPSAEDAFWLLVAIIENILPREYYSRSGAVSGAALETDGNVLLSYVNDFLSQLHKHIAAHNVSLTMFTPGWFISAFAACLSGEPLYRFWDLLFGFCDGRYLFCFGLALLKVNRRGLLACTSNEDLMMYLGGKMTNAAVGLDVLVAEARRFSRAVTGEDLARRRNEYEMPST